MGRMRQISITFKDVNQMAEAYMPFLTHGGFFIPTDKPFQIGDEIFIALTFPDEPSKRNPAPARVVWINNKGTSGGRKQGIGVAFTGVQAETINKRFEQFVLRATRRSTSTNTM